MANTLNIQTESLGFKIRPNHEPQYRLGGSGSEGSVMLVEPDPTLPPSAGLTLRDSGIKFNPYIPDSVLAQPLLHPIAVEFGQGKLDEPRPSPEFVALINQLLTTVEIGAKSYDMSVDDDGGMSFIIVPVDGTLISGEITTSGNLYAWHYDTDWTTQIGEIEINQDISWLLGLLGVIYGRAG